MDTYVPISLLGCVGPDEWKVANELGGRAETLGEAPEPWKLLELVWSDAKLAESTGQVRIWWERCCDCEGFGRVVATIPLRSENLDWFFNGRSGYRAQYYISELNGILFNHTALRGFAPVVESALREKAFDVGHADAMKSLLFPYSKLWLFNEKVAFDEAIENALRPTRWVMNNAVRGLKAPLPRHGRIEIKGAFLKPGTCQTYVDPLKLDRANDLYMKGFT